MRGGQRENKTEHLFSVVGEKSLICSNSLLKFNNRNSNQLSFYLLPSVNKPIYRSMENLNSNSAFHGLDNHTNTGGGRFPTLPLSGFTFTPNSSTSSSSHLMVPGSPTSSVTQTLPRNPRVVPMITRSQSSSNLPENTVENPYDEVGGGFSSRANHRMPKKSCSQWDMVGASGKNNHLQVGRRLKPQTDVS